MLRFLSGVLAASLAAAAFAQDDAVVVTATRFPQQRSQTLQPVTVITAEDIAESGQQTLLEVLQSLGGVEVASNGGFGQPSSVFMRGANAGHTLVLVDGMRMGSATTGATALENIPLSQIERIEVVPGELSSLYGSEAIGGVIQIFTRGAVHGPAASASAGIGSFDTSSMTGGLQRQLGDTTFSVSAGYFDTAGFDATKPAAFGHNADRDPYRNGSVSAKLANQWRGGHEIGATVFRSEGTTHFDSGPASDDVNAQTLSSYSLYSRDQLTGSWRSLVRAGESTDDSTVQGAFPGFFTTRQPQLTWQNDIVVGPGTAIAGVEYLAQHVASDTAYTKTYRDVRAAFAGYTGTSGRHSWQANLRQDDNSQFGSHTTGLAGYAFALTPALRARAALATAFKAPTFNDLYFPGFSNPDLRPERSRSREIGLNYQSAAQRLSATYFDNRISELIVLDPTFTPQNLARARITGTELAYELFAGPWHARARATFQDPVDDEAGTLLPRRARQHASLALARAAGRWKLGGELVANGARFDQAGEDPATRMHGYALVNLTASYALSRALSLRARWNNVFDRDYELVQNFNTPRSNVFVALRYQTP
ncbi:MAG TPA: TonB-dependent receptor [Burkholderiales bacterium]|nr:TonB-dependent receptor [Burkholderiales bacterium]